MERTLKGYKALASYFNISKESARQLMNRPDFPKVEISPRVRIIMLEALEEWIKEHSYVTKN